MIAFKFEVLKTVYSGKTVTSCLCLHLTEMFGLKRSGINFPIGSGIALFYQEIKTLLCQKTIIQTISISEDGERYTDMTFLNSDLCYAS